MYRFMVFLPIVALTACDLDSDPLVAPNLAATKEVVEENYAEWKYYEQNDYMFNLSHTRQVGCGDSGDGELPEVQIVVRDGAVHSVTYADESEPGTYGSDYPIAGIDYIGTIDHIFEWILEEIGNRPQVVGRWYGTDYIRKLPVFNDSFNYIEQVFIQGKRSSPCWSVALYLSNFS